MSWARLVVEILGTGFWIYLVTSFYGTFLEAKPISRRCFVLGFGGLGILITVLFQALQNSYWMPLAYLVIILALGLYYYANHFLYRILSALIFIGLNLASEMMAGAVTKQVLGMSIEQVQGDMLLYGIGSLGSKLLALVLIRIIGFFFPPKNHPLQNKWFALAMVFLPFQSMLLCFVVQDLVSKVDNIYAIFLGTIALSISFLLIFITMFIMNSQMKVLKYEQENEASRHRLQAQIEHYNELYEAQKEIRAIRHEMSKSQIALFGLLEKGELEEAMKKLRKSQPLLQIAENVFDTGFPSMDAVLNATVKKASEHGISLNHKILIDGQLHIDQFDLALLLANALDNAMEAIVRSSGVDTGIRLHVADRPGFLSILVDNQTSVEPDKELRTAKEEKSIHGFGMHSMREIANKYEGDLNTEYDPETRKFSLKVLLKNKKA